MNPYFVQYKEVVFSIGTKSSNIFGAWVSDCRIENLLAHWETLKTAKLYLDVDIN